MPVFIICTMPSTLLQSPAPQTEVSENGEWTVLNKDKETGMETEAKEDEEDVRVVYPTIPQPQAPSSKCSVNVRSAVLLAV